MKKVAMGISDGSLETDGGASTNPPEVEPKDWESSFQTTLSARLNLGRKLVVRFTVIFGQSRIQTLWFTSGKWGCHLDSGPTLAVR